MRDIWKTNNVQQAAQTKLHSFILVVCQGGHREVSEAQMSLNAPPLNEVSPYKQQAGDIQSISLSGQS